MMTMFKRSPSAASCCRHRRDSATMSVLRIVVTASVCCYLVAFAEAAIDVDILTENQLQSITVVPESTGVQGQSGVCVVQLKNGDVFELRDGESYGGLVTMNDDCQHKYHTGQLVVRNFSCVCDPTNTNTGVFCPYCHHPDANAGSRRGNKTRKHRDLQRGQLCSKVGSSTVMSTSEGIEQCTCAAGPDKIPTRTCGIYVPPPPDPIDPPVDVEPVPQDVPPIPRLDDLLCFKTNNADETCPNLLASTTDQDIQNLMCGQDDTCLNYCDGVLIGCCNPASNANDFVMNCNTICSGSLTTGCHRKPEVPSPPPPPPPPEPVDPVVPPLPPPPPPPEPVDPVVPPAPVCKRPLELCTDHDECCAKICLGGSCMRSFKRVQNKVPLSSTTLGDGRIRGGRAGQLRAFRTASGNP